MKMNRGWRTATAGLAATALLLTATTGIASAQSADDLPGADELEDALTPEQIEELLGLLTGDDEDEDEGDEGDPLQDFLEGLDPSQLEELLEAFEGTPLEDVIQAILDALEGDGEGEGDGNDEVAEEDESLATEGEAGDIPEAGMGGFSGYAEADSATVFVGLPAELAEGLAPVLEGLGIAGSSPVAGSDAQGIRIDLGSVQANLERAAAGEEISSEASAFVTNLLLASPELDEPGACEGGPMDVAIPEDQPFLTLTLAGVDCEESDERAFADVQFLGLNISLAALIAQGDEDGQLRDGLDQVLEPLNEGLGQSNELLCPVVEGLGLTADNCASDTPILQVANPLDIDVPLVDLDLTQATAEVTQDGESITATANSSLAGANLLGVACAGQDHMSTATSDGSTATRDASVTSLDAATCNTEQTLLRLLLDGEPIGDIGVVNSILQSDLFEGSAEPLFDGLNDLADALSTTLVSGGQANLGPIEGAGTSASTSPFVIVRTLAFSELEGSPLEDLEVVVAGGETAVGVNAAPEGAEPPAQPDPDPTPAGGDPTPTSLPRTGAGAGLMLGLGALGAAAALRRRDS